MGSFFVDFKDCAMPSNAIDYAAVIQDLENRRLQVNARFETAIQAIKQIIVALQHSEQPSLLDLTGHSGTPVRRIVMATGAGKSMVAWAMAHLAQAGGPVPNMELA